MPALPRLGAHFVTPIHGGWEQLRAQFRRGRFEAAKIMIPEGFAFEPSHVDDLVADGAKEIVLRSEDDDYTPDRIRHDLVQRGFLAAVERHPEVQFWLELGNEQNLAGMDPWVARFWMLRTRQELDWITRPNLRWMASMPTLFTEVEIMLVSNDEGSIGHDFDGVGAHLYGHFEVDDGGGGDWLKIFKHLQERTSFPIVISEFGVNHDLPKDEKAQRYLRWMTRFASKRVPSVYLFCLAEGSSWPQYEMHGPGLDVLAERNGVDPNPDPKNPEQAGTLQDAVRQIQSWIAERDDEFEPIEFEKEDV